MPSQLQFIADMLDVILKRFDKPDETRLFARGEFELIRIGSITIGRANYAPGWRWPSTSALLSDGHFARSSTPAWCSAAPSSAAPATAALDDVVITPMHAGELFQIPPGHESWVAGEESYVSLHFEGAEAYASK